MTEDGASTMAANAQARRLRKRRKREEDAAYYSTKMHAAIWVAGATFAAYYSDIFKVCFDGDKRINKRWFAIGVFCFTVCSVIILYMAIWVPRILGINLEPNVYNPRMLPTAAVFGVIATVALNVGLWPVYGILTPGLLGLLWFGGIMSAHFLPGI